MRKALSLISGGLDSLLATKLIIDQGVHVEGINFFTGFTGDHNYCFKRLQKGSHGAKWVCDQLGIKLHVVDIVADFKPVLLNPRYGYGANINPCLDCKLFMVRQAKKWIEENGFDFLVTGEVLGQRPKSQRKDTLPLATKVASDLIVRPLSAKLLPPTLPEREGWINRELLCDFAGRGRKSQMELAKKFNFKDFPQPGGGCVLTDINFCKRLQDLLDHRVDKNYVSDDVLLLHLGRHLRINPDLKVIIGRDEVENEFIEGFSDKYILLQTLDCPGALLLLDGKVDKEDLLLASRLAAYFSKGRKAKEVKVLVRDPKTDEQIIEVSPLMTNDILSQWCL
ncbi:MAG: tRNA (5-methylaminomethyl-2-thiouridylate)-methyltransferase [Gammaproteobacteria bacterium]|nr:tRNA (5-methylaminomethyl-2-thiouridylate)-methyltransferase [Gammaproteobacteria bacterium]